MPHRKHKKNVIKLVLKKLKIYKKGFTLIDILIVICLIGLLVGVLLVVINQHD